MRIMIDLKNCRPSEARPKIWDFFAYFSQFLRSNARKCLFLVSKRAFARQYLVARSDTLLNGDLTSFFKPGAACSKYGISSKFRSQNNSLFLNLKISKTTNPK